MYDRKQKRNIQSHTKRKSNLSVYQPLKVLGGDRVSKGVEMSKEKQAAGTTMVVGGIIIAMAGFQSESLGVMALLSVLGGGLVLVGSQLMGDK